MLCDGGLWKRTIKHNNNREATHTVTQGYSHVESFSLKYVLHNGPFPHKCTHRFVVVCEVTHDLTLHRLRVYLYMCVRVRVRV